MTLSFENSISQVIAKEMTYFTCITCKWKYNATKITPLPMQEVILLMHILSEIPCRTSHQYINLSEKAITIRCLPLKIDLTVLCQSRVSSTCSENLSYVKHLSM